MNIARNKAKVWPPLLPSLNDLVLLGFQAFFKILLRQKRDTFITTSTIVSNSKTETK